jgi:hypothetical protein
MKKTILFAMVLGLTTTATAQLQGLSDASQNSAQAFAQAAAASTETSIKLSGEGLKALKSSFVNATELSGKAMNAIVVHGIKFSETSADMTADFSKAGKNVSVTLATNIGEFSAQLPQSTVHAMEASLKASGQVVVSISEAAAKVITNALNTFGPSLEQSTQTSVKMSLGIIEVGKKMIMAPVELIKELRQATQK